MPRYWDRDGNAIGFKAALRFQTSDPNGYRQAQTSGRTAKRIGKSMSEVANSFRGIELHADGRITSRQGGGSLANATARVDTSGSKAIASRRTMMRTVTPLAVLGQKKLTSDTRQCFLIIEGKGWAIAEAVPVDDEAAARAFAAKINATVASSDVEAESPADGIADQIRELAALAEQGILTADEFARKKTELLKRM